MAWTASSTRFVHVYACNRSHHQYCLAMPKCFKKMKLDDPDSRLVQGLLMFCVFSNTHHHHYCLVMPGSLDQMLATMLASLMTLPAGSTRSACVRIVFII